MSLAFKRHIEQIQRRWWVVVSVAAIAVLAAVLSSLTAQTKYVGQATLVVSSQDRSEDEKVVLGYATVFNDPATIDRLRATRKLPHDVTFAAQTVGPSPILAIEATADNPNVARESAKNMAEAFRDDINAALAAANEVPIADLQRQLDEVVQHFVPGDGRTLVEAVLRERINTLKYNAPNQLHDLQLTANVKPITPNLRLNVALGSAAGLLLGILAALGMAAVSTRIGNAAELREKTGIEPLVEIPSAGSGHGSRVREDRLRTLANVMGTHFSSKSTVVAVIDSHGVEGAGDIAERLAKVLAQQEYRTVLVHAEVPPPAEGNTGFDDVLRDSGLVHVLLKDSEVETLKILPRGRFFANRYSRITPARIAAVLDELRADADVVVVAAPSIAETPDAQLLCAAADLTIVVVDAQSSRAEDVTSVVGALETAGAVVLGAVLINGSKRQSTGSTIAQRPHSRHARETADQRNRPADAVVPDLHQ